MLKWNVTELMKYKDAPLHFEDTVDVKEALQARDPEIIDVSPIQVEGDISYDKGDFLVSVTLTGKLTVPSTRSLTPVVLEEHFTFSEIYLSQTDHADHYEEGEILIDIVGDELDLTPAIEDHLLLSIPMQVLTPQEAGSKQMPAGKDWEVISEQDYSGRNKEDEVQHPFDQLKDLFPQDPDTDDK